jgi:hypothetical protein
VTFLAFTLATAHGILAGSDSGSAWAAWLYTGAAAIVTFLLVVRICLSMAARLAPPVSPAARTRRVEAPGAE